MPRKLRGMRIRPVAMLGARGGRTVLGQPKKQPEVPIDIERPELPPIAGFDSPMGSFYTPMGNFPNPRRRNRYLIARRRTF